MAADRLAPGLPLALLAGARFPLPAGGEREGEGEA